MTSGKETIGFIGIGLMGKPMVLRLLGAGYQVTVWNRTPEKLKPVVDAGAIEAESIASLVRQCDLILFSLANTAVVEELVFGNDGVASAAQNGQLIIDLSSIDPDKTRIFAAQMIDQCGIHWIDAPVSGGVVGAEQGSLVIMAGGREVDLQRSAPVLNVLGQRTTHMGDIGAGQITKICNQMIVSCNALVIAEMIALAKQAGVAAEKIPEALAGGFADSKPLQILAPEMAAEDFEPVKWRVETLAKDLNMAVDLSRSQAKSIPISGLAAQLMQLHASNGYAEKDPSTLIKLYTETK